MTAPHHATTHTVLVVDDERVIRTVAARVLARAGIRVVEAEHGAAALELLGSLAGLPALVLTDIMMPVMNGRELQRELARRWPGLPVRFMTGYGGDDLVRLGVDAPDLPLLHKPFTPAELTAYVAHALPE
jgi:two-component system cell cycle sensor histidine kinase/response regulator CckA